MLVEGNSLNEFPEAHHALDQWTQLDGPTRGLLI
jgi:hypothetical protein